MPIGEPFMVVLSVVVVEEEELSPPHAERLRAKAIAGINLSIVFIEKNFYPLGKRLCHALFAGSISRA